jgi:hypothetical protein
LLVGIGHIFMGTILLAWALKRLVSLCR